MLAKIQDSRAFLGALALLIVGVIMAFKVGFFFAPHIFGDGMLTSRWWWEIVLNLQILCLAFMWFCHHDRIVQSKGRWRLRAIINFVVGMISVAYPVMLLVIGAYLDWFRTTPPESSVVALMLVGLALWAVGSLIIPIFTTLLVGHKNVGKAGESLGLRPFAWLTAFWPSCIVMLIIVFEAIRDSEILYMFVPVFMYLQGALPYLNKARHASPRDSDI
ncbi:hypothetical protein [Kordiimonas aestuarii]|uniref:hypothetical protein n=1 Tax=Kordiimonas aestuarii TaxID=1005925 RepID=UPI0021D12F68|nr:hypothetical protein [Kordiimonas aestuarii]